MPDLKDLLHSGQAEQLMKDKHTLDAIQNAPETQQLLSMLSQNAGGDLEGAASAAAKGDSAKLMGAMSRLLNDPEGKRLVEQIRKAVQK